MLCNKCQKRPAIVFVQRMENGEMKNEGYCLSCARELGIKPLDDIMKQFGISGEDLEAMEDRFAGMMENGDMDPSEMMQNMMGMGAAGGAHTHHVLHHFRRVHVAIFHHAGKAVLHGLQIFTGDAELLHDIVQRLDAKLARAGKAVAFIFHFAVLHALHEHDGRAFLTFVTKHSSGFLSGPK